MVQNRLLYVLKELVYSRLMLTSQLLLLEKMKREMAWKTRSKCGDRKKETMSDTFDIPFSGNAAALLHRAKSAAAEAGATLTGDEHNGEFSGKGVEGHYE